MKRRALGPLLTALLLVLLLAACSGGSGVEKNIFVAPTMVECEGEGPQMCLLIKENAEDDWQLWYQPIEGFDYQEGILYELTVEEQTVDDPPAGGSSIELVLVEEVSHEPVAIRTIYIGPERVECQGEGPQLCYQYKERPEDDWLLYYNEIDGFEYEEGYVYELMVAETNVPNPPAGGSSVQLTLVDVADKSEPAPDLNDTVWVASALNGQPPLEGSELTLGLFNGQVIGSAGCNRFSGQYETAGDSLAFGELATTGVPCPRILLDQQDVYVQALESVASFRLGDGQLLLLDEKGETILSYDVVAPALLEGTLWQLVSYNDGQQAMKGVLPDTRITALFENGTVGGSAGCNNYSGPYELSGALISIGPLASTMMACGEPEGIMEQEANYLAALQSAVSYRIIANRLEFTSESGELAAVFTVAESAALEDTPWTVISYNNGRGGVVSVITGTELTTLFTGGTVSGSAGCNDYSGPYELDGAQISVGPLANTEMACAEPEGIMEQETEFLAALQSVATYVIDGDTLDMRREDGARALTATSSP
ncbi:MAG: META domain-containing protein [Chloroflexota bacterium]|nr:MAG: META domain-containing protein [Chloroflexota bacterium]